MPRPQPTSTLPLRSFALLTVGILLLGACVSPSPTPTTELVPEPPPPVTTTLAPPPAYLQADLPVEERVEDLLSRMTLAEKIGQMTLVEKNSIAVADLADLGIGGLLSGGGGAPLENTPEAWADMIGTFQREALGSRLGIPLIYGVDAVHGHNNVYGAVIFPHNIGLGATNDPDLVERIARVTALEMVATGAHWNYAPAVSVVQDIRWGRTYEGYSEDPAVVSRLGAAYIRGLQGANLSDPTSVLATPKHFVGDGGTTWGTSTTESYWIDQGVTEADEATLRALHLPPYEAAIAEGALSIMASYSSWGGEKMHAQHYLLTTVLKGELAFSGFVVSDWAAIDQVSDDYYEAIVRSINAGIDMNMVPGTYRVFIDHLTTAVDSGDVPHGRIDDAVRRILRAKFELGLFEHPHGDRSLLAEVGSDAHRGLAREAVAKSQVLLKNDRNLLPFPANLPTLHVAGQAADDLGIQSGGWTVAWQGGLGRITEGTTILEGIRRTVTESTEIVYDARGRFDLPEGQLAAVCLAVVGEHPYAEGMGDDGRPELPGGDIQLLERLRPQCESMAVVILSGRPLLITDAIDSWDALVAGWLPGSEGQGVADVLFGLKPFTGTLSYTWPASMEQVPVDRTGASGDPLFPFGFSATDD